VYLYDLTITKSEFLLPLLFVGVTAGATITHWNPKGIVIFKRMEWIVEIIFRQAPPSTTNGLSAVLICTSISKGKSEY
jgi:hypothetical protein